MLKKRIATWRAIFAHPWVYWLGGIYGVVGLLDSVRTHILPAKYHDIWDRHSVMPNLSLGTWAIIGLVGVVVILLEGSYRLVKQQDEKHHAAIQSLRADLTDAQQKIDYRIVVYKLAELHQQCLQLLMRKIDCNDAYISWKQEIEDWYDRAQIEIELSLGFSEKELFRTFSSLVFVSSVQPFNDEHQQDLQFFGARYHKLESIIVHINAQLR